MKAIILAAGRGSRMKNLTDERPKCMVNMQGKPLLEWQRQSIVEAGINEIALVTGYKRELLSNMGFTEFYNNRWAETNMVSSLECANEWLLSEPCIVSYSDIFYDTSAVASLRDARAPIALTYDPNWLKLWERRFGDPLIDAETFLLNMDYTLAEIGNKPRSLDQVQGQYMGLLKITPEGWSEIRRIRSTLSDKDCDAMHMTGTLQKVIDAGKISILAIPYDGVWGEIDNEYDLSLWL